MSQTTICLMIFVFMIVIFFVKKIPMSFSAMLVVLLLVFTGCVEAKDALASFASNTVITMASMFVVAAGLTRTQMINKISSLLYKVTEGSFTKVLRRMSSSPAFSGSSSRASWRFSLWYIRWFRTCATA